MLGTVHAHGARHFSQPHGTASVIATARAEAAAFPSARNSRLLHDGPSSSSLAQVPSQQRPLVAGPASTAQSTFALRELSHTLAGKPPMLLHGNGRNSHMVGGLRLGRVIPPAEWELPPPVPVSTAWCRRALAAEATLEARARLREELARAAELGIVPLEASPPLLVSSEHPVLAIPPSRARLQFNESPGGSPHVTLSTPVSVETAASLVVASVAHGPRRKRNDGLGGGPRYEHKLRPASEPLGLPTVPQERRQRLPRLTLKRTLPKVAAAAATLPEQPGGEPVPSHPAAKSARASAGAAGAPQTLRLGQTAQYDFHGAGSRLELPGLPTMMALPMVR